MLTQGQRQIVCVTVALNCNALKLNCVKGACHLRVSEAKRRRPIPPIRSGLPPIPPDTTFPPRAITMAFIPPISLAHPRAACAPATLSRNRALPHALSRPRLARRAKRPRLERRERRAHRLALRIAASDEPAEDPLRAPVHAELALAGVDLLYLLDARGAILLMRKLDDMEAELGTMGHDGAPRAPPRAAHGRVRLSGGGIAARARMRRAGVGRRRPGRSAQRGERHIADARVRRHGGRAGRTGPRQ